MESHVSLNSMSLTYETSAHKLETRVCHDHAAQRRASAVGAAGEPYDELKERLDQLQHRKETEVFMRNGWYDQSANVQFQSPDSI